MKNKIFSLRFAGLSAAILIAVTGCQSHQAVVEPVQPKVMVSAPPIKLTYDDIWDRIRSDARLNPLHSNDARIRQQRQWYIDNPRHLEVVSQRSAPYIHYIVEQLAQRNMPLELALLPMVESAYDPLANSSAKAAGLWQFMPATGRQYDLAQTQWYDGRRDIMASTRAALNYLSYLNNLFNGDWLLTLAAYNAGEGRVQRAMQANINNNLPADYWSLNLPRETQNYVPKLLALADLIRHAPQNGLRLAQVPNKPYFTQVALEQHVDLTNIAQLSKLNEDELIRLNPAYKHLITLDGPKHLLVPQSKASQLKASLAQMNANDLVNWQRYHVKSGDTLYQLARRHQVSVNTLKNVNNLDGNNLRIGQVLTIPNGNEAALAAANISR